jgi:hypothetical protein
MLANLQKIGALFAASLALTGCIHYEHDSAKGKPAEQVVTIQQFDKSLTIVKIDGEQTLYWLSRQSEYRVGVGIHTLQVRKFITAQTHTALVPLTVELVPGRTYGLYGFSSLNQWSYDIRDIETGKSASVVKP